MIFDDLFQLSRHFLKTYHQPYVRYLLKQHSLTNRFSIIAGQRGVGKSTAMIQYLNQFSGEDPVSEKILYVPVDHFMVGQRSLFEIAETFFQYGGELVCFDEIHKYKDWSRELKSICDSFPALKIIASGSSAMAIEKGSHDLSRRAIVYKMAGLSFREFLELSYNIELPAVDLVSILKNHEMLVHDIIRKIEKNATKILPEFRKYLRHGYFPFVKEYDSESLYFIALEQGLHTTIESDLLAIYPHLSGVSIKKLKKLLSVIAASASMIPDMKRLKNIIEVGDERTLKNYLKYLEDAKMVTCIHKSGKGLKALEKPEKIYLNNPNQAYAICRPQDANIGTIREIFFSNILLETHEVRIPPKGDFLVDGEWIFEVGGKGKSFNQIKDMPNAYLAVDEIETGVGHKIPLWLFGFLY